MNSLSFSLERQKHCPAVDLWASGCWLVLTSIAAVRLWSRGQSLSFVHTPTTSGHPRGRILRDPAAFPYLTAFLARRKPSHRGCLPRSPFLTAHSFGLWGDRRSWGILVSHFQASPGVVLVKSLFLAHSGWLLLSAFPSKAMTDSDPPCLLLLLSSCVSQRVGRGAGASPLGRRHRPCLTLRSSHYGLARLHLFLSADRRPRPPLSLLASSYHRPPAFVRGRFIHTLQGAKHATHQRHQQ